MNYLSPAKPWNLVIFGFGRSWKTVLRCLYELCNQFDPVPQAFDPESLDEIRLQFSTPDYRYWTQINLIACSRALHDLYAPAKFLVGFLLVVECVACASQCFDIVGWVAGRASGLHEILTKCSVGGSALTGALHVLKSTGCHHHQYHICHILLQKNSE